MDQYCVRRVYYALTSAGGTHIRENILKLIKNVIYNVNLQYIELFFCNIEVLAYKSYNFRVRQTGPTEIFGDKIKYFFINTYNVKLG